MNTERAVKLTKKDERKGPEPQARGQCAANPNRWSKAVQSWVSEFQKHRRDESLRAFDSLFK